MIQPSSVDVRIDRYFRLFDNHKYPYIDPAEDQPDLTRLIEVDPNEPFILHPGEFVLGATYEQVSLPDDTLVAPTATLSNPAYQLAPSNFPSPMRLTADYNVFYFGVVIPGQTPETGFATAGTTSNPSATGTATVVVSRSLGSTGAISVSYASANGTAPDTASRVRP